MGPKGAPGASENRLNGLPGGGDRVTKRRGPGCDDSGERRQVQPIAPSGSRSPPKLHRSPASWRSAQDHHDSRQSDLSLGFHHAAELRHSVTTVLRARQFHKGDPNGLSHYRSKELGPVFSLWAGSCGRTRGPNETRR